MKNRNNFIGLVAIVAIAFVSCSQGGNAQSAKITNQADSVAYAIGNSIGGNIKPQFPDLNPAVIAKGIADAYAGNDSALFKNPGDADQYIRRYMMAAQAKAGEENIKKGKEFLDKNKTKAGVQVTASGLQYEILKAAEGPKPTAESTVKVHYHGTTIDGDVFDSSVERGEPVEFPLNGVIPGWTEGVQLMSVGSKYKFYIPSELAYGSRPMGDKIKANSTLIFEVELLEIVK